MRRGQALVELALALPLMCLLAFGGAALTRLAAARSGLDAATAAAAATAAREPALDASGAATATFQLVASRYPLGRPTIELRPGRPGQALKAVGSADVDLGFARLQGLPVTVHLVAITTALAEPWRSRP